MFTGIVEKLATVRGVTADGPGRALLIESPWNHGEVDVGDSIAINGVCLTVITCEGTALSFQAGPETLAKTNLGELRPGDRVNLERALLPTTRLSGHFVQGHVDGLAHIAARRREADWEWVEFIAADQLTEQMVHKGSVAIDGVSLTLVTVSSGRFQIMLIPYTLAQTTLGFKSVGAAVNVEIDILSKYVRQAVTHVLAR